MIRCTHAARCTLRDSNFRTRLPEMWPAERSFTIRVEKWMVPLQHIMLHAHPSTLAPSHLAALRVRMVW
jgi:hypothetical protein